MSAGGIYQNYQIDILRTLRTLYPDTLILTISITILFGTVKTNIFRIFINHINYYLSLFRDYGKQGREHVIKFLFSERIGPVLWKVL